MSTFDYRTMAEGEPLDPGPAGGVVGTLTLFTTPARAGSPAVTVSSAERVSAGRYRFTIPDVSAPAGRYWARVVWTTAATGGLTITENVAEPVDLPTLGMAADPEDLAVALGISLPITGTQRDTLAVVLADAQADVEGYLGRPIVPTLITERRCWPAVGGWRLAEQPVVSIVAELEEIEAGIPSGYWTVHYWAGLDTRGDPRLRPVRRVLLAHAATQPAADALWRTVGGGAGAGGKRIKSVSAEGQSVSYDYLSAAGGFVAPPGSRATGGAAGGPHPVGGPVLWSSIDRWRLAGRRVYQRPVTTDWERTRGMGYGTGWHPW